MGSAGTLESPEHKKEEVPGRRETSETHRRLGLEGVGIWLVLWKAEVSGTVGGLEEGDEREME